MVLTIESLQSWALVATLELSHYITWKQAAYPGRTPARTWMVPVKLLGSNLVLQALSL